MEPKLRFTKFNSAWELVSLEKVICERSELASDIYPLYSLTIENGVEKKTARYNREFLVKKIKEAYKLLYQNDFVINPMNLRFGAIAANKLNEIGRISKYYDIFSINKSASFYFFDQLLTSKKMLAIYEKIAIGGLNEKKRVHFSNFVKIKVPVPQLEEQNQISDFLSTVNKKIMLSSQQYDLLCQYKKGMMQKIFSRKLRLKDDDGATFPDWENQKLGDVAIFLKGKGVAKADVVEYGERECIRYGELYTDYGEVISKIKSRTNQSLTDSILSISHDVLIPSSGETAIDISKASCVLRDGVILGGDLNIIRSKIIDGMFLSYYINCQKKQEIAQMAQGNSVVHLYAKQLAKIEIFYPCKKEQTKIAEFLSSLDDKIAVKKAELDKLKTWKQGLLQQMFV